MWLIYVVTGFPRCDSEFDFIFLDGSCYCMLRIFIASYMINSPQRLI